MKSTALLALSFLILSCGGNNDGREVTDDTETLDDSIEVVSDEHEEVEQAVSYYTVEDYASITNKEQLISQFGEENLVDGVSWYAEGTVRFDNTVLTDPDNGHVIKFVWAEDGQNLNQIEAGYYVFDENYSILDTQMVFSDSGVFTGMSLAELREWNGADFDFLGFGWDYEGGIFVEEGSRFAECPVIVKLSFELETEIPDEYNGLYGDTMVNTADEIAQGAPVIVDRLTYQTEIE